MSIHTGTLQDLLEEITTAITAVDVTGTDSSSDATAYQVLDRLDQRLHLGFTLEAPDSADTDRTSGDPVWIEDTVVVVLSIDVSRTAGQQELRNLATLHEHRIREAVHGVDAAWRPTWRRSSRSVAADKRWYEIRQTFRFERLERRP